jgi:parvulin-like peptidyl-prolyl isomerase
MYTVDDLTDRMDAIGSELQARYLDLTDRLGGVRDSLIQQGQQAIQDALTTLAVSATDSLVLSRVLADAAGGYGITVSGEAVDAEVTQRKTLPERLRLSLITVAALPDDAEPGDEPTDADFARAETEAKGIAEEINAGASFAETAKAKSDDSSAPASGLLGWVEADDLLYATYFEEAQAAAKGDVIGPIKDDAGYHLLQLDDQKAEGPHQHLLDLLQASGVSELEFRTYIRGDLLKTAFNDYFTNTVMRPYQPAREVAQIFIAAQQGVPVPQQRLRHYLAQPLPGEDDQSKASDAEWAAALARAEAFRVEASKPDADWFALATESDDTGSGSRGGDLGWYDPATSNFVPEFKTAVATLSVGEVSEPVKTQFGYHVIEVTGARATASDQAKQLVATLRDDPDQFARLAKEQSEDASSAVKGGELGWVIPYQFEEERIDAIFNLTDVGEISEPIETTSGFYIFKLLGSTELRFVPAQQLESVRQGGFSRWLGEIEDAAATWTNAEIVQAPASA